MRPLFVTIEGADGAGKTTAAKGLQKLLEENGIDCLYTREPGGSQIAEKIRDILLDRAHKNMDAMTEAILYAASRRQHLTDIVLPAMVRGKTVICDRFVDSSLAYQGYARGLGFDKVWQLNQMAMEDCLPDVTFLLEVSPETARTRRAIRQEQADRIEAEGQAFQDKVMEGFELCADRFPRRIRKIDASRSPEQIAKEMFAACQELDHG